MRVLLLRPVASPWITAPAGDDADVPDEIATVWIADGVAEAYTERAVEAETAALTPPENAARPPARPRNSGGG